MRENVAFRCIGLAVWMPFALAVVPVMGQGLNVPARPGTPTGVRTTKPGLAVPAVPERPPAADEIIRARRIVGLGAAAKVQTPDYKSTIGRGASKPPQSWVQITVTYDTYPEWIDELMIRYYALSYREEKGKKLYSLYKNAERCFDIKEGRAHLGVIYLRPAAIERHGELVAVAAEFVYQGNVVGEVAEVGPAIPDNWWKNPQVTESEMVTARDGYLVERNRSPFAFINIGEYEYAPY